MIPPIEWREITDSTNDDVRELALLGAPHGTAVFALQQRAGRGRLGRSWEAVPKSALLGSLLLKPRLPIARFPLCTLATAVGLAQSLDELMPGHPVQIKWPNDLVVQGGSMKKLAGILAELEVSEGALIVGVGLNVSRAPEGAVCLEDLGEPPPLERLAQAVRMQVLGTVRKLETHPAEVLNAWRRRSHTLGRRVRVGEVEGIACELGDDGSLVLDTGGTTERIMAGDVAMVEGLPSPRRPVT